MRSPQCDDSDQTVERTGSEGVAQQLTQRGFARFALAEDDNDQFTLLVQRAIQELREMDALRPEFSVAGDACGPGAGFHYFPTNDPAGRPSTEDGHFSGLRHMQTWDQLGRTDPPWPEVKSASARLREAADILSGLAGRIARALEGIAELEFVRRLLDNTGHDGVVLRTNVSRGIDRRSPPIDAASASTSRTATRHIWHTDATLWTLLCLQDFSKRPPGVSETDRLVYETAAGGTEIIEPKVGHVILFPGRHLAALMDVSPRLPAWRHAVVSRDFSERVVTMLRIGFDPGASELHYESGRRLVTRDGVDVGSGPAFYTHLQALQGAPLILDGSPAPRHGRRGAVDDVEMVDA